jgi:ArsR family transcriptional regulator, arsenate/arsenite/antimonite-responsive transcriptional repressor
MSKKSDLRYESRARVAKAMAHPSRLRILDALAGGERCAGDLVALLGAGGPTVSQHLTVLRNAGLVTAVKRGQRVFYRAACSCIDSFFTCIDTVVAAQARSLRLAR